MDCKANQVVSPGSVQSCPEKCRNALYHPALLSDDIGLYLRKKLSLHSTSFRLWGKEGRDVLRDVIFCYP